MLTAAATYEEVLASFSWNVPERYNIAREVIDRHALATPDAVALIHERPDGRVERSTFREIQRGANRIANVLAARGLGRGDRIGIQLGQCPEMAITFIAAWKLGAVAIPISTLFGEDALEYRLANAGAKVLVTDRDGFPMVAGMRPRLPDLAHVLLIDGPETGGLDFWGEAERAADHFDTADTAAEEPAYLAYTSGTTGPPKGALHAHCSLIGHMPGFDILYDFFGQPGDLCWSPADWAWLGGLMDVLIPSWWHGKPVLAYRGRGRFDPERAYHLMAKHNVRNTLMMPTMLKLMRQVPAPPKVGLRSLWSGGETVGEELLEWGQRQFGIPLNEGYGQTECNLVLAHLPRLMRSKPGSLGQAVPGHVAAIVDDAGNELPTGEEGQIAFRRPDPVMLLEYWNDPAATSEKYAGDWLLTGDVGTRDEDGYFWFKGRADDVITSSGYRIGPGEIEDCLLKHPAVALAAAIGAPDPIRTERVKAFIVPAEGVIPDAALEQELREFVRGQLSAHEYPREFEFVDEMPTTTTGKIMRRVLKQREIDRGRS